VNNILISGAGIAGLSLARQLEKYGIAYTLIEKKPTLQVTGTGIALPANAVSAMRYMGFSEAVDNMHQVREIIYSRADGRVLSQASLLNAPLNRDKFVALERLDLLNILKHGLENNIHFDVTITGIKPCASGVDVAFSNPALNGHYSAVIGTDGIHSTVRDLGFGQTDLVDLGVTSWRWICEYPSEHVQPTYMLGRQNMFLAYPIGPHRIYCYAHQSDSDSRYHHAEAAHANLRQLFANYQGIAKPLFNLLPDNTSIHTGRLRSVPHPLFSRGDLALIGDAGNACSPMLQQGAACAFEDAIVLAELLAKCSVRDALKHYQEQRQERVNWIVKTSDNSIRSFVKMHSPLSVMLRNWFIKRKGPLNVSGWMHLLASCPLDAISHFKP
jgi:2-polyprenyl-6-methoxyphenol hydroxylase-like FAD-dependent oxidoreductase